MNLVARYLMMGLLLAAGGARAQSAGYYAVPLHRAGSNPRELNTDPEDFAPPAGWQQVLAARSNAARWSGVTALPTGFAFRFAGAPVTTFKVSSTGVLTFDVNTVPVPSATPAVLPNTRLPARAVCVWGIEMDSMSVGATPRNDHVSRILTRTFGVAPNRQFWVQLRCWRAPGLGIRLRTNWSIVLEETSNVIYVVDHRVRDNSGTGPLALTVGVQSSATQAVMAPGSPALDSDCYATVTGPGQSLAVASPRDNTYYAFIPGAQPAADLALETAPLAHYRAPGAGPLTLRGRVRNLGAQAAAGYTISYRVNGGPVRAAVFTGGAVAPAAADTFRVAAPWLPPGAGTYRVKLWVRRTGTPADAVPANDTLTRVVEVADRNVPRRVLLEMATASSCPPCAPANDSLKRLLRAFPSPVTVVKYQQNFPGVGDPYATPETIGRFLYYYGGYIPYTLLDGHDQLWNGGFLQATTLAAATAVPATISLDAVSQLQWPTVRTTVRLTPHLHAAAGALTLHTLVLERRTFNNATTNGETEFDCVVKKLLPDLQGTLLGELTPGRPVDVPLSYAFPASNTVESPDSLYVVALVQDAATREVLQSVVARVNGVLGVAPDAPAVLPVFTIAPNPTAAGHTLARFTLAEPAPVALTVFDALGRVVLRVNERVLAAGAHALPLDLRGVAPGVYAVRATVGSRTLDGRLVVN